MKKDLLHYINELIVQVKRNFDYYTQIQNLNSLLTKKDKEVNELKNRLQKQININQTLIHENLFLRNQIDKFIAERNKANPYNGEYK